VRIGIFTDQYLPNISGVVTSVINLRAGLEALGHEVFIVAPANRKTHEVDDHVVRVFSVAPMVTLLLYPLEVYSRS
jgi:1,2-diacylglycerol 3-alpha-glucosyltransferase